MTAVAAVVSSWYTCGSVCPDVTPEAAADTSLEGENMSLFRSRRPEPAVFPVIKAPDALRIHQLIDRFEATRSIADTEAPARELASISNSAGWDDSRSIWIWFAAWSEQAASLGTPLTAVKIAEFTQTYHERFLPAAGSAGLFLGHATDAQRSAIETAAFDACFGLDSSTSIRADMDLPVQIFHEYLGSRLGRAAEIDEHVGARPSPAASDSRFLRVWSATYEVDRATKTYTSRTVSGESVEEVMAEARRRAPEGTRVVYISREDDLEPIWAEETGFTSAADEPHEFRSQARRLFRDVAVGERFYRGFADQILEFEKVDGRHFRNPDTGKVSEIDPYNGVS